jgi:crossover junction endodeoxyribonuclease RusA
VTPLTLEIVRPNLGYGPNDRVHWRTKATRTRDVRMQAYLMGSLCRKPSMKDRKATMLYTITWAKGKRRLNDADNLLAQLKPVTDGLKDAGLIHDDSPDWLTLLPVEQRKGTQPMISIQVELTWV